MKQSLVFSIVFLLISSSSLVAPIHARNKSHQAKSPAPAPSISDCSTIIFSMMDCLSYLSIPATDDKPGKTCCDAIESVLEYNPQCVCVGLQSSQDMGIPLNNTRALAMPSTCKLSIPAPHCAVAIPGASTPGLSPASPSTQTPKTSPSSAATPSSSPSLAHSPALSAPSPSTSATDNLSFSTLTILAVIVSSIGYLSTFPN